MTQPDARLRGHLPALDGVRGIAIALVLAVHFTQGFDANGVERAIAKLAGYGLLGVDLFFVLSGFLITGILVEAKGRDGYFRNFYARRALRIFPLYYGVLVLLFVVAPVVASLAGIHSADLDVLRAHQLWAWLYSVNIFDALHGGPSLLYLNHFWSLGVEEHFYLVWPLVVWAFPARTLLRVSAGIALASLGLRLAGAVAGFGFTTLYELTPFRLDQLCFGGFLAIAARSPGGLDLLARVMKLAVPVAVATAVGLFGLDRATGLRLDAPIHALRTAMWTVLFGGLVVAAVTIQAERPLAHFLRSRAMTTLGKYSYGLYVFHHFPAMYFIRHGTLALLAQRLGSRWLAVALVPAMGMALSFAVAVLSFRFFEKPFLDMKRAWASNGAQASRARDPMGQAP